MSIEFNHTIVWAHDSKESANFLCQILGLPAPAQWGPFQVVKTSNGVSVDYTDRSGAISAQHYAYLMSEPEFDEVLGRVKQRGLEFWADPARTKAGEINHRDGGRGMYFEDPNGHILEILTRPYGSGGGNS
jgi:catechol 2,3-dioxygenase-like lactoylglutathione lyase family enzyme